MDPEVDGSADGRPACPQERQSSTSVASAPARSSASGDGVRGSDPAHAQGTPKPLRPSASSRRSRMRNVVSKSAVLKRSSAAPVPPLPRLAQSANTLHESGSDGDSASDGGSNDHADDDAPARGNTHSKRHGGGRRRSLGLFHQMAVAVMSVFRSPACPHDAHGVRSRNTLSVSCRHLRGALALHIIAISSHAGVSQRGAVCVPPRTPLDCTVTQSGTAARLNLKSSAKAQRGRCGTA